MERKSPKRIDRGLVMEAIKSMYGEEVFKQYVNKEVAYSILPEILGDVVYSYLSEIKMKDNTLTNQGVVVSAKIQSCSSEVEHYKTNKQ